MSRPTSPVREVRIAGPLASFAADFQSALRDAGYTPLSAGTQLRLMAHLSRWLDESHLTAADLTAERVEAYLRARRAAGCTWLSSRRGLAPLLDVLAARQALPAGPPPAPGTPTDVLLAAFGRYLRSERGLEAGTTAAYVACAARFLSRYAPGRELEGLTARDVTGAVLAESATHSVASTRYFIGGLRAFLRFCCLEGLAEYDLSAAALPITGRRTSSIPRGIGPTDARALLHSCDRRRAVGRRDFALLVTLLRLGLRASEVSALALDDIDWRAGEFVVHGKGRRTDRLPMPADVGEAIADYLRRGRPTTARREVFLRVIAPVAPLSGDGISSVVRRACQRAGVPPVGAHRLRHSLACAMVRSGVPLPEIGGVLRHRSLASTTIYARVDLDALRRLARPWPSGPTR
jgi:site-specific recombinase XerD